MEIIGPNIDHKLTNNNSTASIDERLNFLLAENAETARRRSLYPTPEIELEVLSMSRQLGFPKAYALLGLMLGLFPPASFFLLPLIATKGSDGFGLFALLVWVNTITALVGYFSGKVVGKQMAGFGERSFTFSLFAATLTGFLWGAVCGAAGGVFIFVIGAIFGAIIGGFVGAVALPIFYIIHKYLKRADMIELKHFLPVATAITISISAFILGYLRESF